MRSRIKHPSEEQLEAVLLLRLPGQLKGDPFDLEVSGIIRHLEACFKCQEWASREREKLQHLRLALAALRARKD